MEVLHGGLRKAALTCNRLVTGVVERVILAGNFDQIILDLVLQQVEHVKVGVHEEVRIWIFVGRWRDPAGVDSEKRAKLLIEVGLFDVGARFWRNPQFLRIGR